MADFSALKTAIQTYIKQNGNEEITGEVLQTILLSVVTTLGDSAINDLITALNAEVAARQNADSSLEGAINQEGTLRSNADSTLQGNINAEATARENADTALSNRLGSTITAENTAAEQIGAEAEARAAADTALRGLIDGITDNIENGYVYAGIATPSSTPATGKVFYLALTAGTYTHFGNTVVTQGINILKYNGSAWSLDAFIGIDDELTPISNNLPKSGNVLENIIKNGSAFDLSAYNAVDGVLATYADLDAALTALNVLPAVYKQGGMSVKFVQSSDNKYMQFRCIADEFTTDVTKWQGVNDKLVAGSEDLAKGGVVEETLFGISNKIEDVQFQWKDGRYGNGGFDPTNSRAATIKSIIKGCGQKIKVKFGSTLTVEHRFYLVTVNSTRTSYTDMVSYKSTDYPNAFDIVLEDGKYYSFCIYAASGTMNGSVMNASQDTYLTFDFDVFASIKDKINSGYLYKGIANPSMTPETPVTKVMYLASVAGTYTNFGGIVLTSGINIIKYDGSSWSGEQLIGIDSLPTLGSHNLLDSDGVAGLLLGTPIVNGLHEYSMKNGQTYLFVNTGTITASVGYRVTSSSETVIISPSVKVGDYVFFTATVDSSYITITNTTGAEFSIINATKVLSSALLAIDTKLKEEIQFYSGQTAVTQTISSTSGNVTLPFIIKKGTAVTVTVDNNCGIQYHNSSDVAMVAARQIGAGTYNIILLQDTAYFRFIEATSPLNVSITCASNSPAKVLRGLRPSDGASARNVPVDVLGLNIGDRIFIKTSKSSDIVFRYASENVDYRSVPAGIREYEVTSTLNSIGFNNFDTVLNIEIWKNMGLPVINNLNGDYGVLSAEQGKALKNIPSVFAGYGKSYLDSLGKYIRSYNLGNILNDTPFYEELLNQEDIVENSAGKTLYNEENGVGYIYVLKYENNQSSTGSGSESRYLYLVKMPISDPSQRTFIRAIDENEVLTLNEAIYSGATSITVVAAHEGAIAIENNNGNTIIRLVTNIEYNDDGGKRYQVCAKFFNAQFQQVDPTTLEQSTTTYKCKFGTADFNKHEIGNGWNGNYDGVFNAGVSLYDGYYYGAFGFGFTKETNGTCILKSQDFINWEFVYRIPVEYNPYGEASVTYSSLSNNFVIALRVFTGTVIMSIDTSFENVIQASYFKASKTGSMASLFWIESKLYALIDGTDAEDTSGNSNARNYYKIVRINLSDLRSSEIICDTNGVRFGPNTILSVDSSGYIYGCITSNKLKLSRFRLSDIDVSKARCDSLLGKILALE